MNKRIKKKVTKRAIQKYDCDEKLSAKEIKLIAPYIFLKSFDFDLFRTTIKNFMSKVAKAISEILKTASDKIASFAKATAPEPLTVRSEIATYYGGTNPND